MPPDPSPQLTDNGYYLRADNPDLLDGCMRCQDGNHWSCHGCSCPCGTINAWDSPEVQKAKRDAATGKERAIRAATGADDAT